jgi:hypothetical protein
MAFKVNYGLERAERNRVKQAKKEAKAAAKKAGVKSVEDGDDPVITETETPQDD